MINPYIIRKYLAYLLLGTMPMCAIVFGISQYGLYKGIIIASGTMLVCAFLTNVLIDNPFRRMLEGKGLLVIGLDSTGVLDFHVLGVSNGRLTGNIIGKKIYEPYDQNLIHTLYQPKVHLDGYVMHEKEEEELMIVDMRKFRQFKFGFNQYPVLLFNKVTRKLMTKEFIGGNERMMASHLVYVASERAKDLNATMLNFSRTVVDKEHNTGGIDMGKLLKYFLIGIIVLGIGFFAWKFLGGGGAATIGNAVSSAQSTVSNTVVTPR